MAEPGEFNLEDLNKTLLELAQTPQSEKAEGGVADAAKQAAGPEAVSFQSAELDSMLKGLAKTPEPAEKTPLVTEGTAPVLGPDFAKQLDSTLRDLAGTGAPKAGPISQPGAPNLTQAPPEEDINAPWSDRLAKRFEQAWNAPGEGIVGHTWGVINTPIISETDIEAFEKMAGGNPEDAGGLFGGVKKGVYSLLGGLTSPLSLAFIIGTAGAGALADSGGVAALRAAKMGEGEIETVVKGSKLIADGIKMGQTSKETTGLMELAGINSKLVNDGLDILAKAGMTSHDLIKGSLIRTATASGLRQAGVGAAKAETIGRSAALLIDGGFAAQNIYGAALAAPRALDALKSGDLQEAGKLITEAAGLSGFGLLGTHAALKEAGGLMGDFQVKMGLKVRPSDENIQLQREFGIADRQMVEAGRTHELWAEGLRETYKVLSKDPDALHRVRNLIEAEGDSALMQRNYNLIAKSAGRDVDIPTMDVIADREIAEAPKTRENQPTVIPEDKKRVPLYESDKYEGGTVSQVFDSYHKASEVRSDSNPYVRISDDPIKSAKATSNEGRTLMIQISSNLINDARLGAENMKDQTALDNLRGKVPTEAPTEAVDRTGLTPEELATQYYDKLYANTRPGYARMQDFWEIPDWIARSSHFLPDADVYVVRSVEQAKSFLNQAKYDRVLFSALDVNKDIIKSLLFSDENKGGYAGRVDMGGYVDPSFFKEHPNVHWQNSLEGLAQDMGVEFKSGVNYRHFQGSDVIPRLTMSAGCLHKCAFCIANTALKIAPKEVVDQQAGAIAKLGAKLAYLNDKTFGQAKNYQDLAELNAKIKKENPGFLGFVVQTTAAQMGKIPEEWLAKSGIKYIELGIESFNDPLLKEMHKPATELLINKAVDKLRKNKIALIPNILIGYPGETAETYANTMNFLKHNRDIISHANVYNLALYKDAELGKKMTTAAEGDFNENVMEKSWHKDPNVVKTFAGDLYGMLQEHLGQTPDVLQSLKPLGELTAMEARQLDVAHRREVFTNVLGRLPSVKELVQVAKAGSMGREWYERSIKAFDSLRETAPHYFKPEDADVWAGVLASTSPQQSVAMNLREALTFWKEWKDSGKLNSKTGVMEYPQTEDAILKLQKKGKISHLTNQPSKMKNLMKALNREPMFYEDKAGFFKVGNFASNLQDIEKDPGVTSDSWIGTLFGVGPNEVAKASFYHAIAVQTRLAAQELGWEPKQAQAAMWTVVKGLSEKSGWKNAGGNYFKPEAILPEMTPEEFSTYSSDFADLLRSDKDVQAQLLKMGVPLDELNKKLEGIPRPEAVEGATEAISSDLLKRTAQRIGKAQQQLEGFTKYKRYQPEGVLDFGATREGDTTFDFGANAGSVKQEIAEAAPKTETPEFREWFGKSKIVDESGAPKVVYHGTAKLKLGSTSATPASEFSEFRTEISHDIGAHFGTSEQAAGRLNYSGEKETPRGQRLYPVYLRMENPVRLPDMTDWSNPDAWTTAIEEGRVPKDIAGPINKLADRATEHREAGSITSGYGAWERFAQDVKAVLEKAGYDGVVYKNEHEGSYQFDEKGRAVPRDKTELQDSYVVFHPQQIKSAIGNLGTFDLRSADIRREIAPTGPLSAGAWMFDPQGNPIKMEGQSHAQWVDKNFPEYQGARWGLDKVLDKGYVRVVHAPGHQLLIDVSADVPNWQKKILAIEDRTLESGDRPITIDINKGHTLVKHLDFDNSEQMRDYFSREVEPIKKFADVGDPDVTEKLAQFETHPTLAGERPLDVTAATGAEKLGTMQASVPTPQGNDTAAGLFTNQRGENTLVLAGPLLADFNRVTKNLLVGNYGVSTPMSVTKDLVKFLANHPLEGVKSVGEMLKSVEGKPLSIIRLTGAHPFVTMLHEHIHGALTPMDAAVIQSKIQELPGYDKVFDQIKNISGVKGQGYKEVQDVWEEIMPRLVAGQLFNKGVPTAQVTRLLWEGLNAISDQTAYEKVVGNLHPYARKQLYEYLQSEGTGTEGRKFSPRPTEAVPGGSEAQARPIEGAPEPRQIVLRAGDASALPDAQATAKGLSEFRRKWSREFADTEVEKKEEPSILAKSLENINIKEGFTVNPKTGFVPQKEGYSVEAIPERRQTLKHDATIRDIEAFVEKNRTLLEENPDLFIGGWGRELNISTVLADAEAAQTFGKQVDQKDAWDFFKGDTLDLGGTGKKVEFPDFPLDERLEYIRKNSISEAQDFKVSRDLSEAPRETSESRLHELAAQGHIKKNYSEKEIDALLRSYDPSLLTDEHHALAKEVQNHFSDNFERANKGGALAEGLSNYVTHMWEKTQDNPAATRLMAEAQSGRFAVNTSMARHRTFQHAIEGQLLGRKLKVTDPIALAAHNGNTFDRVLAARDTLTRLQDKGLRASDGRPMVALSGTGSIVQGEDGENPAVMVHPDRVRNLRIADKVVKGLRDNGDLDRLLKEGRIVKYGEVAQGPDGKPLQHYAWATNDYRSVSHPAFEGWQFASQDTNANPVLVRGDLKVHPEAYDYVKRQLETQSPLAKHIAPVFAAGREAKGILLSFDVFHLIQESMRALMTGVSPFGMEKWDLKTNPTLGKLVEHGLTMGDYAGIDSFQEGQMVGHSKLLGKVPVLGPAAGWFQDFLFKKYVPSLKARAAEHLYEKYKQAYPEYSDTRVAQLAAEDTNMRFGGLNLRREGRALMTEDIFRLVALAPDWLESEMRSMSRALGGDGKVMRRDLAKVAIGMWLAARVLNQLNTGNAHYEAPFGVAYKDDQGRDKVVSLRTLPTDMLHAVTDPVKFMRYRMSPLQRTINTVYSGRDSQGRRLPTRDLVWDVLGDSVVPLPLQNVTQKMSGFQPGQNWKELGVRAMGAQVTAFKTEAGKKAAELAADRSESGPVDPDKLRAHTAKIELEDRVRVGEIKPEDLWKMVDQDLLNPKDAQAILKSVQSTRGMETDMAKLYTRASRLPMPDFMLVWDESTSEEKAALTKLMLKKKITYFKKAYTEMTASERMKDPTYLKLRKLFPEQPLQ